MRDVGSRFFVVERGSLQEQDSPEPYFASLAASHIWREMWAQRHRQNGYGWDLGNPSL